MVLTKDRKAELIKALQGLFGAMPAALAANYSGLSGVELTELRKKLKEREISVIVTKNTLVKIALEKLNLKIDQSILDQPTLFAFGGDEAEVSRALFEFGKQHGNLEIIGGMVRGEAVSAADVKVLALLPSKEELRSGLLRALSAPTRSLVGTLFGNIRGLVGVLKAREVEISKN